MSGCRSGIWRGSSWRSSKGWTCGRWSGSYRGSGSASYHPAVLLGLLVYGYATGVFSSRKLERATYDSVAFRFIAGNEHPDHDTIATFRRRFLKQIEGLFVEVLKLAQEMGVLKLGTVALDGTKIHANASRHSALSYEHARKIEAQLKQEVAGPAGQGGGGRSGGYAGRDVDPGRVGAARGAPGEAGRGASARSRRARRSASRASRRSMRRKQPRARRRRRPPARKPGGKPPQPPAEGPLPTGPDQPDRRRLADHAGGGWRVRAVLQRPGGGGGGQPAGGGHDVVQAANDKQQLAPMVEQLKALPEELGKPETLLADNGYFSAANVEACAAAQIEPLIAPGASRTIRRWRERFRRCAGGAGGPDAGRGYGASAEHARGQAALRAA